MAKAKKKKVKHTTHEERTATKRNRVTRAEAERRVLSIQNWLIDDEPTSVILENAMTQWKISDRQAYRYIALAESRWKDNNNRSLSLKRAIRIQAIKKAMKEMSSEARKTPSGLNSITRANKEIARLEGIAPTRQMIDAEFAKDQGQLADPMAVEENSLSISITPAYKK